MIGLLDGECGAGRIGEGRAREARIGLWVDPHPVPPWEWRKRK